MTEPYYSNKWVTIYNIDCLEGLKNTPDSSIDLIATDPPYNIRKDTWDTIPNYIEWSGQCFLEYQRVLRANGSFYFFHNNIPTISQLVVWLQQNTKFIFKQFIVWNKRFDDAPNKGFLDGFVVVDGLRNYQQMAEYCLFYTFQDETGLTTVMLDTNNFPTLRLYFKTLQTHIGLSKKLIVDIIGQCADHAFRWESSQWGLPTKDTYRVLTRTFNLTNWEYFREYESLRREYESLRYVFNNQKTHHSVWNYPIADRVNGHSTPKPVALIDNILRHSSNNESVILDPFLGTGATAIASMRLNRRCIGFEIEEKYCEITALRCTQEEVRLEALESNRRQPTE